MAQVLEAFDKAAVVQREREQERERESEIEREGATFNFRTDCGGTGEVEKIANTLPPLAENSLDHTRRIQGRQARLGVACAASSREKKMKRRTESEREDLLFWLKSEPTPGLSQTSNTLARKKQPPPAAAAFGGEVIRFLFSPLPCYGRRRVKKSVTETLQENCWTRSEPCQRETFDIRGRNKS